MAGWKDKLRKQIAQEERAKVRAAVRALAEQLREARRTRREQIAEVRSTCKLARAELRERHKAERQAETERRRAERAQLAGDCKLEAARTGEPVGVVRKRLAEERHMGWLLRAAPRGAGAARPRRTTAAERRAESDEDVAANLPPSLVGVWRRVERWRFKAGPRRSRTEAFLEWAQENPGEVWAMQSDAADADVAAMVAEYEALDESA